MPSNIPVQLSSPFTPNRAISPSAVRVIVGGQVALFILWWVVATPAIIPKPLEVLSAMWDLVVGNGLIWHLCISLMLYFEAVVLATVISLGLSYLASMEFCRPLALGWTKLRFLGLSGLTFLLTLYIRSAHNLKLAVLTLSISVFMTLGMLDVLDSIPQEKYDLAHTLRMNDWQTLWEVEILGRIDVAFDVLRGNAAMGWMMLGVVEALWRSEGGIGTILANQDKTFQLAGVAAIQISILSLGLLQDYLLGKLKSICCPYASMLTNRK